MQQLEKLLKVAVARKSGLLHEHEAYELLGYLGIRTPAWYFHKIKDPADTLLSKLPHAGPFVAKAVLPGAAHKTDIGAVAFNVTSDNTPDVVDEFAKKFAKGDLIGVLFVEQIGHGHQLGSEMLIGMYRDQFFGPCFALGFGGTGIEYYKSIMRPQKAGVILPASFELDSMDEILKSLSIVEYLEGRVRGAARKLGLGDLKKVLQKILKFECRPYVIEELEINPAIVYEDEIVALDCVVKIAKGPSPVSASKPLSKIGALLNPKSVAIAGASGKRPGNFANIILRKLLEGGLPRDEVYVIHPKEEEIDGAQCVKDVTELLSRRGGRPVDCLVVGVPAAVAGGLIASAFDKYAAHAIQIISAGFGETEGGKLIQDNLGRRLLELGETPDRRSVVNGPNTLGNIYRGTSTMFAPAYKSSATGGGRDNVALICQSGAFMIARISDLGGVLSPRIAISVGNQMDLSVTDFLEYLLGEKGIDVYGLYIEGLNPGDGLKLMRLVREAGEKDMSVVIYKAGRTKAGREAAKGHTAAMAGDYDMFTHLLRLAGAIVVETSCEFENQLILACYCDSLSSLRKIKGRKVRVAALSNAGFEKCAAADHLFAEGKSVEVAGFTDETRARLVDIFSRHGVVRIIDQQDILDLSPMMNDEGYDHIMRTVLEDQNVDIGLFSIVPETVMLNTCKSGAGHGEDVDDTGSILNRLIKIRRDCRKPFIVSLESGAKYDFFRARLLEAGIPVFRRMDAAARTVAGACCTSIL